MPSDYLASPGNRLPPGATADAGGVNFSVFSRDATAMQLCLYERADSENPLQILDLDPAVHRTFFFWHIYVERLPVGTFYTWRCDGPSGDSDNGFRFDSRRELVDPWAREISDAMYDRQAVSEGQSAASIRAIVVEPGYDWSGDVPLDRPMQDTIIYELHVAGFTRDPSSAVAHPGTFEALIEKTDYLRDLGVTDVQLMPVMAFDEQDMPPGTAALGLKNFWGYSTHSFFAPHPGYCRNANRGGQRAEFRDMVRALHQQGLGVILDVVFNHTAEGGESGPILNFKGLGNDIFYHLDPNDRRRYRDFTGCGNTVNCNHPLVANFIDNCLEYWVREMHVDGFRFDLASVLGRGENGEPMYHAPVLWNIEFSAALSRTRLIAEAWDAGGLYQVGDFPGLRWAELNGRYRDVLRRFVAGEPGLVSELATRITGSSDFYARSGRLPINSVNFVTCHDGFTLWDLVRFEHKHNAANGEQNRDGNDANYSWNCGVEGQSDDPAIDALRRRQARNLVALLFLSQGVPLLLSGDEVLRSQGGNNNVWCQDNALGWFDWSLVEKNADMLGFVKTMIGLRKRHPSLRRARFLSGDRVGPLHIPDIGWHGVRLDHPPWHDTAARHLAYTLAPGAPGESALHVLVNMEDVPLRFELPRFSGLRWIVAVDSGSGYVASAGRCAVAEGGIDVLARTIVVLESVTP
jgi:glycogen operon protein